MMRTYGNGTPEDTELCVEPVWGGWRNYQCTRKRRYGPNGAYCKQHDPDRIAEKRRKQSEEWDKERAERDERDRLSSLKEEGQGELEALARKIVVPNVGLSGVYLLEACQSALNKIDGISPSVST